MFTANTMATALDFLGISPAALSGIPATHERKADAAIAAGRLVMDVVRRDLRPSQLITRAALENAAACVAATGGSTNGVLHLIAIARELGIEFTLDDFERVAARTPIVASLKPGGAVRRDRHVRGRRHRPRRARAAEARPHPRRRAERRRRHARRPRRSAPRRRPGQEVVVPIEQPIKPTGGLAILYGNLAPEGCVVKLSGHERTHHRGPARVFDSEEDCFAAVKARTLKKGDVVVHPLRGPGRRARHARDAARHRRDRRRGPRRGRRADHRRALLGRHARLHGRPRRARGRARRAAGGAARGRHRHRSTSSRASCASTSPTTRSPSACATSKRPAPRYTTGVFAKYAALVSSASDGAVTRAPNL